MKKIIQILSIALMLAGVSASAQVTSTISTGNWNTAGNWSNGVPGDGATATINNSMTLNTDLSIKTGNYTVTDLGEIIDPAGGTNYSIDVSNSGILDVSGNVLIGGNLLVRNSPKFTVRGCDTMTVQGNVTFSQTSTVTVESCAVLFIDGDMD